MHIEVQPMACGGCGCGEFRMYKDANGLLSECVKCASVSTIYVSQPHITIGWGDNANGVLTVMQPNPNED